jgi:hypothetical protein
MSILALALYGSRARQDQHPDSDVDLFAITDESEYRMIVQSNVNIACYPRPLALQRAENGDLFMLHIVREAKTLLDISGEMDVIRDIFKYKDSYESEIRAASDIAWFLCQSDGEFRNYALFNRRVAWCVRTMLIAKSAEMKCPYFSTRQLGEFSGSREAVFLIENKANEKYSSNSVSYLRKFLSEFGRRAPLLESDAADLDYANYFASSGNVMGLKTLSALRGSLSGDAYD